MTLASGRGRAYAISLGVTRQAILCSGLLAIPLIVFPLVGHLLESPLTLKPHVARQLISTVIFQPIFVAVGEELFFRGFRQGAQSRTRQTVEGWHNSFWLGVVAVALLFDIGHLLNHLTCCKDLTSSTGVALCILEVSHSRRVCCGKGSIACCLAS